MQIQLNQQNQQRVTSILQQINQLQVNLEELIKIILDSQDIDYSNNELSLSEDLKTIILNEKINNTPSIADNSKLSDSKTGPKETI
jgi:hypothetical protein